MMVIMMIFINIGEVYAEEEEKDTCIYAGTYTLPGIANPIEYKIIFPIVNEGTSPFFGAPDRESYFNKETGTGAKHGLKGSYDKIDYYGINEGTTIKNKKCPTIYGYIDDSTLKTGVLKLYPSAAKCKEGWAVFGGNRDSSCKTLAAGVYQTNGKRVCTSDEIQKYTNETLPYFKKIEDVDKYIEKLNQIDLTNAENKSSIQEEIENVYAEYTDSYNEAINAIKEIQKKYDCDLGTQIASDFEAIQKLYSTVYKPKIKKHSDQLIETVRAEKEAAGEDTSYLDKIREETGEYFDILQDRLNEAIEKAKELNEVGFDPIVGTSCGTILGSELIEHIQEVFDIIKIVAPILLIFFGSMDYGKAVVANDKEALAKATSNFIKRAIAAVAIFLLPYFIKIIFSLPGVKDVINVNDPTCTVSKVVIK